MNAALQGYLAAVEESLAESGALEAAAVELSGVSELVVGHAELSLALNDGSVPVAARRAVLDDLLEGKVLPDVRRLVHQAVTVVPPAEVVNSFHWLANRVRAASVAGTGGSGGPEAEPLLGRLGSRHRVSGYAAAVLETLPTDELEDVEDELFRFARTVEANVALRRALGDRDLPVELRQAVLDDLLEGRALPATRRLAGYAVRGGRARDFVATLDGLVEETARVRGWRVARVRAADEVDEDRRQRLGEALGRLTGGPVELQVAIDPQLLGGVVVQVGDLLVDGTTRHRLDELKENLLISGTAPYRAPQGRESPDG